MILQKVCNCKAEGTRACAEWMQWKSCYVGSCPQKDSFLPKWEAMSLGH